MVLVLHCFSHSEEENRRTGMQMYQLPGQRGIVIPRCVGDILHP